MTSYYTFFLIHKFGVSVQASQVYLFVFLAAVAAGTFFGGPLGDRFGRKLVIWFSILGVLPFTLALPYANLFWTGVLSVAIGVILASAFSTIVVFAQELMPDRVGMIAGMFFGFAFGMGGIGAAVLGTLADSDQHRVRVPRLRVPAGDRDFDGLPARPQPPHARRASARPARTPPDAVAHIVAAPRAAHDRRLDRDHVDPGLRDAVGPGAGALRRSQHLGFCVSRLYRCGRARDATRGHP